MDISKIMTTDNEPAHNRRTSSTYDEYQPRPSIEHTHHAQQMWVNNTHTKMSKTVSFELLLPEAPAQRARLPMRVNIYPHDATDSIITTVKNFYGLYDGNGVSFEDKEGNTLIAQYENFQNRMTVYVRMVDDPTSKSATPHPLSPKRVPCLGPPIEMTSQNADSTSRPESRSAFHRSASPQNGRRSDSVGANQKSRSRPIAKGRTGSSHGSFVDINDPFAQDVSDNDEGNASVASSRRSKAAELASADISVDNIVEGGRRKRARFDSSELPLFVPSQVPMPGSISSVSPQRRPGVPNIASPYQTNQYTFAYAQPLPSPHSRGCSDTHLNNGGAYSQSYGNRDSRQRSGPITPARYGSGSRILPTPDPTIGSVISDEDVALQLMRLGDASNFSSHGRTSLSTVDDALSGKAEASDYSDEASDADDEDHAQPGYASDEASGEDIVDRQAGLFKVNSGADGLDMMHPAKLVKTKLDDGKSTAPRKSMKPSKPKSKKTDNGNKAPISPASLPGQSRKASNASLTYGPDEEDLSTKPRCQRCRKSKKGCDRQRPCGRCRDAGIGVEGCVSEDEGNGRKGRFGRHMGVAIKREGSDVFQDIAPLPTMIPTVHSQTHTHVHAHTHPQQHSHQLPPMHAHTHTHMSMGPPTMMGISQKKRKR